MRFEIVSREFTTTPAIRDHIKQKADSLYVWQRHISVVRITVGDENGPRGGEDKYCKIFITLKGAGSIHITELSHDLYDAITRCFDRAIRVVAEQTDRLNERNRRRQVSHRFQDVEELRLS